MLPELNFFGYLWSITKATKANLYFYLFLLFIVYKVVVNLLLNKSPVCILITFLNFYLCCFWVNDWLISIKVEDFCEKLCVRGTLVK
jgi:hypothetical protein